MIEGLFVAGTALQPAGLLVPGAEDVRIQEIAKVDDEKDWPFVATRGKLFCVSTLQGPVVFFVSHGSKDKDRPLYLDANPYNMLIQNWGVKNALLPYGKLEELIRRIAPFVAMGKMLCKQKNSLVVPGSEL